MKTKKHPLKRPVKKAAASRYSCRVCGSITGLDPRFPDAASDILCCARRPAGKRAGRKLRIGTGQAVRLFRRGGLRPGGRA